MPTNNNIEKRIALFLEEHGFKETAESIKSVRDEINNLTKGNKNIAKEVGNVNNLIKKAVSVYSSQNEKMGKTNNEYSKMEKHLDGMNKKLKRQKRFRKAFSPIIDNTKIFVSSLNSIDGALNNVAKGLASLIAPASLSEAINVLIDYNKRLLSAQMLTARFGQTYEELSTKMDEWVKKLNITRASLTDFYRVYQSEAFAPSKDMDKFGEWMDSLIGVIGPYPEKIKEITSEVSGLSKKFQILGYNLQNINKDDNIDAASKDINKLMMVSDDYYFSLRKMQSLLEMKRGKTEEARQEDIRAMKAMANFKEHIEAIKISFVKLTVEPLEAFSEWIDKLNLDMEKMEKYAKNVAVAIGTLYAAPKVFAMGRIGVGATMYGARKFSELRAGSMLSGAGSMLSRRAAGTAGSILGTSLSKITLSASSVAVTGASIILAGIAGWKAGKAIESKFIEPYRKETDAGVKATGAEAWLGQRLAAVSNEKGIMNKLRNIWTLDEKYKMKNVYSGDTKTEKKEVKKTGDEQERNLKILEAKKDVSYRIRAVIEGINRLYKAQSQQLDANIKLMQMTGKINRQDLNENVEAKVKSIRSQQQAIKIYLSFLKEVVNTDKKNVQGRKKIKNETVEQLQLLKNSGKISSEIYNKVKDINAVNLTTVEVKSEIVEKETQWKQLASDVHETYLKIGDVFQPLIERSDIMVKRTQQMVNLADNFAISVGATARMRMKAYQAEENRIAVLQNQRDIFIEQYEHDQKNYKLLNKIYEMDNKILDAKTKQAEQVKALRDGWVSAIDAMNTAHGGFSKIIINQSKNTAQALQIAGDTMRRSSVSGDIKKGTGFGRAEQFTPFRTITGRHKNLPYMTAIDKQFGIRGGLRSIEMGLRGQVADIIQTKGRIAASGGMTTLGATGNQYRMSAALAQGANVRYNNIGRKTDVQSYIDRGAGKVYAPVNIRGINISFDNFEQLRSIISNEINNAMNQLTR